MISYSGINMVFLPPSWEDTIADVEEASVFVSVSFSFSIG